MKLHRHPGISYNAAWRMRHKLMQGMMERDREYTLAGQVQLDDAYLGGERSAGKRGRGAPGKTHSGIKSSSTRDGRSGGLLRSCARLAFAWESSASGPIGGHVALPGRPHRTAHPRRPRKRYTDAARGSSPTTGRGRSRAPRRLQSRTHTSASSRAREHHSERFIPAWGGTRSEQRLPLAAYTSPTPPSNRGRPTTDRPA